MIPFSHEDDMAYLEKVERQAAIARAEHAARFIGDLYLVGRSAIRAVAKLLKPANDNDAGRRAA